MALRSLEVTVSGWVANNPEIIHTSSGKPVTTFRLMHTPRFSRNGEWENGKTMTFNVKAWSHLASNVQACVRVGNPLLVSGRMEISQWQPKDGGRNTEVALMATSIGFDLALCQAGCWRSDKGENYFDNKIAREALGAEKCEIAIRGSSDNGMQLIPFTTRIPNEKLKYVLEKNIAHLRALTGETSGQASTTGTAFGAAQVSLAAGAQTMETSDNNAVLSSVGGSHSSQETNSHDHQSSDSEPDVSASLGTIEPHDLQADADVDAISVESQTYDDGDVAVA